MPKLKDPNKLAEIHKAAMNLVIQTGFSGLKMADVATAAGIATGTLYIYYKSKEALMNDIYHITKKEMTAVLLDNKHATSDFYETFANMWISYFSFCLRNPTKMLFVEQFIYSGLISKTIIEETEKELKPLDQFLEYGQQKRILKTIDIDIMKAQMQGAIHETIKTITQKEIQLSHAQIDQCFAMAWDGMKNK